MAVLNRFDSDELLREAISIASPSLYRSLIKRPLKDSKQACRSLLNYMTRMACRSTPFGIFSFIATGFWTNQNSAFLDLTKVSRRARPDMEWIYNVVNKFYCEAEEISTLKVLCNSLIEMKGDRLFLKYSRSQEEQKNKKIISIKASPLIRAILKLAKKNISINNLWENLLQTLPNLNKEKTFEVFKVLLSQQILLPSALPSLLSSDPLAFPKEVDLGEVLSHFTSYQNLSLGKGEQALEILKESMQGIASSYSALQVDASYSEKFNLSKEILNKLEHALTFLWKMSATRPVNFALLESYRRKFIEKFGVNRIVPIMDLLSEERGLGSFLNQPSGIVEGSTSSSSQQWEEWIHREWQEAILHHKQEIILNEEELKTRFSWVEKAPPDARKALSSFDLFFKIKAESLKEINQGNYQLYLTDFTWSGGSTFGRFWDLFNPSIQEGLSALAQAEEQLEKGTQIVEIAYWPSRVRNANVAIHPCLRKCSLELDKNEHSNFSLEDLYIGSTPDRFYITSKDGKEELLARAGNVLNYVQAPEPLRLLREITLARYILLYPFNWGSLETKAVFLPRVRLNKCILSPARWNLDPSLFVKKKPEEIKKKFLEWAQTWNLPSRFLLVKGDQHLLFTLTHPLHLEEITLRLAKGESLQLMEEMTSEWLKSGSGSHAAEFVVPFIKNSAFAYPQSDIARPAFEPISIKNRWFLPGSRWIYLKIYLSEEIENNFLLKQLLPFIDHLKAVYSVKEWFYVRYHDPERHLRVRIHLEELSQLGNVLSILSERGLHWIEEGVIKKIVHDSYEREIERYGGGELIETVEALFCADSEAICLLLKFLEKNALSEIVGYVLSVITLLNGFKLTIEEKIALLGSRKDDASQLKGFREYKNQLVKLIPELENNPVFCECASIRTPIQNLFLAKTRKLDSLRLFDIYNHIVHMHCNRLGCDLTQESHIRLFSLHALKALLKMEANLEV